MPDKEDFIELKNYLDEIHEFLFPLNFKLVQLNNLLACVNQLTNKLNKSLDFYHTLNEFEEKIKIKPYLQFSQDLLGSLCRLLRFEPQYLTNSNQIVADIEKMILNHETLIKTKYRKSSEFELKMMADDKLKAMLLASLGTHFFEI